MQKHRILLIGHGNISTSYVQAFSEIKHADIVGVVGRNLEKVKLYVLIMILNIRNSQNLNRLIKKENLNGYDIMSTIKMLHKNDAGGIRF